ncbi:DUF1403 family protein [Methylocystis sp. H4A]|nr:DUF1403 family protein [Methylocystis sp. H4A]MBG0801887.1 DUF1403 family protein [Methylocystis sp. H4A]
MLARCLAWEAPLPLLATTIAHPSMRNATGRRPRPSVPDWPSSVAHGYARAAQDAYALAELSRRSNLLLSYAPKLRANRAACASICCSPSICVSAARAAGLSDRASRQSFFSASSKRRAYSRWSRLPS